ncbi:hypothetical protein [uncultured Phocaeicola sp.]|uniref:hypothetical protein n=1 Tax=uncultured Phocaeicola sp. TaxID=990718 RepID=UPI002599F187|nr:hypothetical protein [uncultured Phocaeicola sp.]
MVKLIDSECIILTWRCLRQHLKILPVGRWSSMGRMSVFFRMGWVTLTEAFFVG